MYKGCLIFLSFYLLYSFKTVNNTQQNCSTNTYGDNCDFILCDKNDNQFSQCKNEGKCIKNEARNEFKCMCNTKLYSGALCEKPICLNYCYNDGKCKIVSDNQIKCLCENQRFTGDRCQFDKCIQELKNCPSNCFMDSECKCNCAEDCDFNYCNKKNGTCYEDYNGNLACKCRVGFSSPVCLIDECNGYCFNGGTCIRGEKSIFCQCSKGYVEKRCSKAISNVPAEYRSSKFVFYSLAVTIVLCSLAIGAYYSIQKGYLQNLLPESVKSKLNVSSRSGVTGETSLSTSSNIHFNKLVEDELNQTEVNA